MSKHKFSACALVFLILFSTLLLEAKSQLPTTTVLIPPETKIEAELAYTDETRATGLMNRESLPEESGMLFLFSEMDLHTFWMKNTLIALDLIWLNERKEVVYMVTAPPCESDPCASYSPLQKAKYVLEVNAGFAKKHHVALGTRLEFSLPPDIDQKINRRIGFR